LIDRIFERLRGIGICPEIISSTLAFPEKESVEISCKPLDMCELGVRTDEQDTAVMIANQNGALPHLAINTQVGNEKGI
jgi:hypothetical protein